MKIDYTKTAKNIKLRNAENILAEQANVYRLVKGGGISQADGRMLIKLLDALLKTCQTKAEIDLASQLRDIQDIMDGNTKETNGAIFNRSGSRN